MVALQAKYHFKCLLALYYHAQAQQGAGSEEGKISGIVFAELLTY